MDLTHLELSEISEDGLHLEGSLPSLIFDIDPADALPLGPLDYRLDLLVSGDLVLVTGMIGARFQRECVRCLEKFEEPVELDPYTAEIEIEGGATINLTERLREDILLSLPAYPHCDTSSDGRKCPAAGRFESSDTSEEDEDDQPPPPGAWDTLKGWKPAPPND